MKIKFFAVLGLMLTSFSSFAAEEAQSDKLGSTPGAKAVEKILEGKDKSKNTLWMKTVEEALNRMFW